MRLLKTPLSWVVREIRILASYFGSWLVLIEVHFPVPGIHPDIPSPIRGQKEAQAVNKVQVALGPVSLLNRDELALPPFPSCFFSSCPTPYEKYPSYPRLGYLFSRKILFWFRACVTFWRQAYFVTVASVGFLSPLGAVQPLGTYCFIIAARMSWASDSSPRRKMGADASSSFNQVYISHIYMNTKFLVEIR